jgi:RNA polymerase sigma-70 factor, ECF subfamily
MPSPVDSVSRFPAAWHLGGVPLRLVAPDPDAAPVSGTRPLTLADLYERYSHYVGAVASRLLGRATEVEDVVQDVFAVAIRGLRRREDPREIKAWLAKVTVRRCLRQLRLRRLWSFVDSTPTPSYERLADPAAGPAERQLVSEVYRVLDGLPASERVAWTLRHVEGESLQEVAELMACSLATTKRRIASAHEKLRLRLEGGTR